MPTAETTAEAFRQLDFHDDTFVGMRVLPAQRRGEVAASVLEIQLLHYSDGKLRVARFSGCTNLRVSLDFDVLADNLPSNTSRHDADTDLARIRRLMDSQREDWDVNYAGSSLSPLSRKLAPLHDLVFFRLQFFGGVVDVVARQFNVEEANEPLQATAAPPPG